MEHGTKSDYECDKETMNQQFNHFLLNSQYLLSPLPALCNLVAEKVVIWCHVNVQPCAQCLSFPLPDILYTLHPVLFLITVNYMNYISRAATASGFRRQREKEGKVWVCNLLALSL